MISIEMYSVIGLLKQAGKIFIHINLYLLSVLLMFEHSPFYLLRTTLFYIFRPVTLPPSGQV